jgi:4-hydroxy-tetrahydrodipicolinate reductase
MGAEIRKAFASHELCYTLDIGGETCEGTPEVMVDFSLPSALGATLDAVRRFSCALVLGTTGITGEQMDEVRYAARTSAVVQSFNFAAGVTLFKMILREFGPLFADWDAEMSEIHHNRKKDAPSGTAILLRESFANEGEVFTLTHRAISRSVFALGALRAAEFAAGAKPGFYSFEEVLTCGRKTS